MSDKCETHNVDLNNKCCNCGAPICCPECCKEAMAELREHLLKNSKPLEPEFSKLVSDKFWELLA
jgi:hypothetical protein